MDGVVRSRWGLGRIGRPIFAIVHLCLTALLYGNFIFALLLVLGPCPPNSEPPSTWTMVVLGSIAAILMVGRLWLEMKRLHDLGWSGWWALVAPVLWIASEAIPAVHDMAPALPATLILAWFLFLALLPGNVGNNRFGPPPTSGFRLIAPSEVTQT